MPGPLQVPQHDQLHEVAEVQGRRRRVEAAVRRDRPVGECLAQRGLVGGLGHQSPPLQLVEDVAHGGLLLHVARRAARAARAQPALCRVPACAGRGWSFGAGRYAETVGSPSSQNRQGYAAASPPAPATPTRGPVRTTAVGRRSRRDPRRRPAPRGIHGVEAGLLTAQRRGSSRGGPGPAPSRARATPARRAAATSSPATTSPGAQQDRAGRTGRAADDVGAPVHAVGEVDVEVTGRRRTSPRCAGSGPGRRATRGRPVPAYASTSVSRTRDARMGDRRAEQRRGHVEDVAGEERPRQAPRRRILLPSHTTGS